MIIVNERMDRLKRLLSVRTVQRIRAKAEWEHVSLSAVILEWPDILPKRLRPLARSCFVATHREWLEARHHELSRELQRVTAALARTGQKNTREWRLDQLEQARQREQR